MDASSGQHQEMGTNSLENMLVCSSKAQQERKPRPQPEQALKCPRCDSTNTKFCYYNNYSLSQPRYFCKSCRRYWTKGGTLRNVPVGGGCRKNKRSSSSSSSASASASSSKRTQDHQPLLTGLPPPLSYDSTSDLSLAFARLQKQAGGQLGFDHDHDHDHDYDHHRHHHHHHDFPILGNPTTTNSNTHCDINLGNPSISLDALRRGFLDTQNNNFQNMYYHSFGGGNLGDAENGGGGGEMFLPYGGDMNTSTSSSNATTTAVTVTTMKQELFNNNNRENDQNKILWGFPWQQQQQLNGGDHHGNFVGDLDTGKESWNGLNSSPWHGLLDSPLM